MGMMQEQRFDFPRALCIPVCLPGMCLGARPRGK